MPIFKTLILRFRDLVTESGHTITEHSELISTKTYAWWGWWNKQNEQVPLSEFSEFLKNINRNGGIDIYLFDTGQLKLYKAKCTDIRFQTDRQELSAPETNKTPKYYRGRKYKAWFKLTEISVDVLGENLLNKFSYTNIDAFFEDQSIVDYSLFNNKIVSSFQELKLQDRTIWFVRDAASTDHNHEIRLTNAVHVQPTHFTPNFKNSPSNRLLWVSDLHFGSTHGFIQQPNASNQQTPLWMAILNCCKHFKLEDFAGVIVSGDISTRGEASGYNSAYDNFFKRLCSVWTNGDFYNWIICPGNHDFGFLNDGPKTGETIPAPSSGTTQAYDDFYNRLFNLRSNKYFCSGRRFLLGNTYPVEIVALNSVNLQQIAGTFQGHGYVGHEQSKFVESHYNWNNNLKKHKPTRIAILHHHILPITYTESTTAGGRYSVSLDAESLTRWFLKNDVSLVLHGHMHHPSITKVKRPIQIEQVNEDPSSWPEVTICSLGSSGVRTEELGEINQNTFGVISFVDQEIHIEMYKVKKNVNPNDSDLIFKVCLPL